MALLVGGVVGYLLGWGLGAPEAKTVTETATETVAPPSYATGEFGVAVTFDGGRCMYNGPAEQPAGTRVDFSFAGAEKGSSLILFPVAGATYEDAVKDAFVYGTPTPNGEPIESTSPNAKIKLGEGLWLVGCTDPTSNAVLTATMLRMVPR